MTTVSKLGIGMATAGMCEARTAFCLLSACLSTPGIEIQPLLGLGCYIHTNRQMIADEAVKAGCSHLLFVDSDMMFGSDTIVRLMSNGKDIVGARYNKKMIPPVSTVPGDLKGLTEVPFLPTGLLLINTEVFTKIGKPYFSHQDAESEDVYFCEKAKANGYQLFCDPTIQVGHLGTAIF